MDAGTGDEGGGDTKGNDAVVENTTKTSRRNQIHPAVAAIIVVALVFGVSGLWVYFRDYSTVLLRHDDVPDGYLPVSEYSLIRQGENQPVSKPNGWHYASQYTNVVDSSGSGEGDERVGTTCRIDKRDCNDILVTSRGIRPGSSWNDFVKRYGGMTAYEINVTDGGSDSYKSYMSDEDRLAEQNNREHYFITVGDFDREYVHAGTIDLSSQFIEVTFRADYQSGRILYTEADQSKARQAGERKRFWWLPGSGRSGRISGPAVQSYEMTFDFGNNASRSYIDDGDLTSIAVRLMR
ncbi:hypothetical protein [Bifidobacterium pluvialisilvae]|uniref:hypothetical protein n=1 Tax=Bifidobacterium pluvialisilvae TaxID=2834436 RepID=UPI001C57E021|nr:hypothetical protein [Bifidobacterium pluvialisilvae]